MEIIHTKSFDSSLKKLKRHHLEYDNLFKILDIIENVDDFKQLCNLPQVSMYGFERLKHDKNDFYSFNLKKTGGKIRLIVKPKEENVVEIFLIDISFDHYLDFDPKRVIYYE